MGLNTVYVDMDMGIERGFLFLSSPHPTFHPFVNLLFILLFGDVGSLVVPRPQSLCLQSCCLFSFSSPPSLCLFLCPPRSVSAVV